jgi:hypothetical protein
MFLIEIDGEYSPIFEKFYTKDSSVAGRHWGRSVVLFLKMALEIEIACLSPPKIKQACRFYCDNRTFAFIVIANKDSGSSHCS